MKFNKPSHVKRGAKQTIFGVCFVILSAFLCSGCAYKRAYKDGVKYESANMYELAFNSYVKSLNKKNTFANARIGMNRSALRCAHQLEQEINTAYMSRDDNAVVEKYQKLLSVASISKKYNVDIAIGERAKEQYQEAQNRYVSNHYEDGLQLLEKKKYNEAYNEFALVSKSNPDYENVQRLLKICQCEPLYLDAVALMNSEKYRSAYNKFNSVLRIDANYKDARQLRQQTLEKATTTIAFSNFQVAEYAYWQMADRISIATKNKVVGANHQFVKLVDENQTKKLLEEQKLAMANGLDLKSNIIPVRYHLVCKITKMSYRYSNRKSTEKRGYVKERQRDGTYVYEKVYYKEYTQTLTADMSMSYSLISVESGLTVFSGTFTPRVTDNVHYAVYSGDLKGDLYPGYWERRNSQSEKDYVSSDYYSFSKLKNLLNARQDLKSEEEVDDSFLQTIVNDLSQKILKFNPE